MKSPGARRYVLLLKRCYPLLAFKKTRARSGEAVMTDCFSPRAALGNGPLNLADRPQFTGIWTEPLQGIGNQAKQCACLMRDFPQRALSRRVAVSHIFWHRVANRVDECFQFRTHTLFAASCGWLHTAHSE